MTDRERTDSSTNLLITMLQQTAQGQQQTQNSIDRLHGKVDGVLGELRDHYKDDADGFQEVNGHIATLRERVARVETNDARDGQDRAAGFGANGTGRYAVLPATGAPIHTPGAFQAPANIEINLGNKRDSDRSSRKSMRPTWVTAGLVSVAKKVGGYGGAALAAWAFGHFITGSPPPKTVFVPTSPSGEMQPQVAMSPPPTYATAAASAPDASSASSASAPAFVAPARRAH